jgi:RNA polymerase sigma-70 factor (ECF subfamily)
MDKELKKIIDTHGGGVRGIIKSITGAQNEDIEQEVYIKTWKNLDKCKGKGNFAGWLKTVAANASRDFLRSKAFRQSTLQVPDDEKTVNIQDYTQAPENVFARAQRQRAIAKAIESLKDKQREVIMLFEIEELSLDEISKKLKCPTGTVKSRLFSARRELAEILKDLL